MILHTGGGAEREILPDYARPDALVVPYWRFEIVEMLNHLAAAAAREVGVILVGPDPHVARVFIEEQPDPDRFAFVACEYDTPWLRDHAPVWLILRRVAEEVIDHRPQRLLTVSLLRP